MICGRVWQSARVRSSYIYVHGVPPGAADHRAASLNTKLGVTIGRHTQRIDADWKTKTLQHYDGEKQRRSLFFSFGLCVRLPNRLAVRLRTEDNGWIIEPLHRGKQRCAKSNKIISSSAVRNFRFFKKCELSTGALRELIAQRVWIQDHQRTPQHL